MLRVLERTIVYHKRDSKVFISLALHKKLHAIKISENIFFTWKVELLRVVYYPEINEVNFRKTTFVCTKQNVFYYFIVTEYMVYEKNNFVVLASSTAKNDWKRLLVQ